MAADVEGYVSGGIADDGADGRVEGGLEVWMCSGIDRGREKLLSMGGALEVRRRVSTGDRWVSSGRWRARQDGGFPAGTWIMV